MDESQIFHFFFLTRISSAFFPQIEQFNVQASELVMRNKNGAVDINDLSFIFSQ